MIEVQDMESYTAVHTGRVNPRVTLISRLATALCCVAGALFLVFRMFIFDQYPTMSSAILPTLLCTFEAIILTVIGVSVAFRNEHAAHPGPA